MIYFVQDTASGLVKIGLTRNVKSRMNTIEREAGIKIRLLGKFPGERSDEMALHERFKAHRVKGEWFWPAPEILDHAKSGTDEVVEERLFDLQDFGKRMRVAMARDGINMKQLAKRLDIPHSTISRVCSGISAPDVNNYLRIQKWLTTAKQ